MLPGASIPKNSDFWGYPRYAGRPLLPDAFGPRGLVAFVEKDELDVPRVVGRRLTFR